MHKPTTIAEAADAIRESAGHRERLRPRGGGSKLGWSAQGGTIDILSLIHI